jgi:MoaA/NifB/PqqE/SkfB family radical SAM enzyme
VKARLLITEECERNCPYCCNQYESIMSKMQTIHGLGELQGYDEVMITGGEPMLDPERTLMIAAELKIRDPERPVYLYTALFDPAIEKILDVVDGVHYTVHENASGADVLGLSAFHGMIMNRRGSYRLFIHPDSGISITLATWVWSRIEMKPWLTEDGCCLPEGEELLLLEES